MKFLFILWALKITIMIDNISTGVKIHDIHHGLIQKVGTIIETEYYLLKELGAAVQIATTIKDHETISNPNQLYSAAGELKITRTLAKISLEHLQSLGFVRLKYHTGKNEISRIDVIVPELKKLYNDIGEYFNSESNSTYANKTIEILHMLSAFPHKEKEVISKIGVSPDERDIILDVGRSASIIDNYKSPHDSENVLFSPLYWDENPNKIFELLKNHDSNDFLSSINKIKQYQGLPDSKINDNVLVDAIRIGCLPTLSVNSTTGLRKFTFTPRMGVGSIEKNLLHKARTLIACVRYGENFAGITKITDPYVLINALIRRVFLRPHSESLKQYEPARNLGLVKIIPAGNRFEVHFIDNVENSKVADMALEMLQIGDTSLFDKSEEIAKKILIPGNILHPTDTRIHTIQDKAITFSEKTLITVNNLLRGVDM